MVELGVTLEGLSVVDLRRLSTEIAYRLANQPDDPFSRYELDFWDAVCAAVGQEPAKRMPLSVFVKQYGRAKYLDQVSVLDTYIEQGTGEMLRFPVRSALVHRLVRLLRDYTSALDIPATPRALINCMGMLSAAVELQFPGYRAARLLHRMAA